jgi:hypothetical protein
MEQQCLQCNKSFKGRSDKKFCSADCKNSYHSQHRKNTRTEVEEIDGYLHRNREILALLMGDGVKDTIERSVLVRAKFRWEYCTGIYKNKENKIYYIVYDYAWMEFTEQKILIVRKWKKG